MASRAAQDRQVGKASGTGDLITVPTMPMVSSTETLEHLQSLLIDMSADSRAEADCIGSRFTADLEDALDFHAVGLWEDGAALAHAKGPVVVRFKAEFPALGSRVESVWMIGDLELYIQPSERLPVGGLDRVIIEAQANSALQADVDAAIANSEIGVQVAAYLNGELVIDGFGGVAELGTGRPIICSTLFIMFSVTQVVAATAANVQAERVLIDYGAPMLEDLQKLTYHLLEARTQLARPHA